MVGIDLISIPSPCQDCTERRVGCHSKCLKYKEFRKKNSELKKKILNSKIY